LVVGYGLAFVACYPVALVFSVLSELLCCMSCGEDAHSLGLFSPHFPQIGCACLQHMSCQVVLLPCFMCQRSDESWAARYFGCCCVWRRRVIAAAASAEAAHQQAPV